MPDLAVETRITCSSNLYWEQQVPGSKGNQYTVAYGPGEDPFSKFGASYSCTCPAFQFRRAANGIHGPCKHITAVKQLSLRCGWGEGAFGGDIFQPALDGTCPDCGAKTVVIQVGV